MQGAAESGGGGGAMQVAAHSCWVLKVVLLSGFVAFETETPAENAASLFECLFPMFVPSLSW
jgi:hypothetical protein